jgi:hypothetical protein
MSQSDIGFSSIQEPDIVNAPNGTLSMIRFDVPPLVSSGSSTQNEQDASRTYSLREDGKEIRQDLNIV